LLQFLAEFLGHFHPVVVHLPIGILLIAALFHFLATTERYRALKPAVSLLLVLGVLCAIVACVTGFLLSSVDDYDREIVDKHQWLGIATAIVSWIAYVSERRNFKYQSWLILALVLMVTVTGHLGGTLTHGGGFLTEAFDNYSGTRNKIRPIANVQDALVYEDIIRPILETRCYGCHSKRKQKGGLRLDDKDFILRGGKNGVVVIAGDVARSELVNRIFLPHENEDHMPPKEKPQLTAAQKDLIKWWVASGAWFDKTVRDHDQPADVKNILTTLDNREGDSRPSSSIPNEPIDEAPLKVLADLRKHGVAVLPVSQDSPYLSANLINVDPSNDSVTLLLLAIDKQLVWLKTGAYPVDEQGLKRISELGALTRLHIGNLKNPQGALQTLSRLKNLQYLTLTGIEITKENADALKTLTSLRDLYLFSSDLSALEYAALKNALPKVKIDTGGYRVPTLASDTTEVTSAQK
jgi:uncharacterized membrane protein